MSITVTDLERLPSSMHWLTQLATNHESPGLVGSDEAIQRLVQRALANASEGRGYTVGLPTLSTGDGLVWTTRLCTDLRSAAFENAAAAAEDDAQAPTVIRVGLAVCAAGLTIGKALGIELSTIRTSIAVGVHAALALEAYLGHDRPDSPWDSLGTVGPLGAAVTVSRLFGLNEDQAAGAIAIAAVQASGLRAAQTPLLAPIQSGRAAAFGVEAVLLARSGITFPSEPIDGRRGLRALAGIHVSDAPLAAHDLEWAWIERVPSGNPPISGGLELLLSDQ